MKKIYAFAITLTFALQINSCAKSSEHEIQYSKSSSPDTSAVVTWHNFNEGIKQALAQRKPIVLDFYADWCVWCKKMEEEVFSEAQVARKLKDNFICIRIYTDKDIKETIKYKNHTLSKKEFTVMLGVQGLPTVVFMDRDANFITKIPGYVKKDVFLPLLSYIDEECYQKKISFNDYVDGKSPCLKNKK